MAALVRFVCHTNHGVVDRRERVPALTVHKGEWAYCEAGGDDHHDWRELAAPDSVEHLRLMHPRQVTLG